MYRKRLKAVYELLDAGNNKKVIQEVEKLLSSASSSSKKPVVVSSEGYDEFTTFTIAKALKSLALLRTGRKQESDQLIDELLDTNTTDENALSIIMQYCKETQQLQKIVTFYENAANKCQKNKLNSAEHEEILSSLFYAYARNRDYAKQQQVAMKLYKLTNKMMYTFWNAASYVLMVKAEGVSSLSEQQKQLYLQLAEKILQKAYDDKKTEFDGEFLLFLNILEWRGKHEEALCIVESLVDTNLVKIGQINFKFEKKISYLKSMNKWTEVRETCEAYFGQPKSSNLDDWPVYLAYFDALTEILKENGKAKSSSIADEVIAFLNNLKFKVENKEIIDNNNDVMAKVQGPYLARIEFVSRLLKQNLIVESSSVIYLDQLKKHLNEYIAVFSSKPGFFYELTHFKELLADPSMAQFVLDTLKSLYDANRLMPNDVNSVFVCLSYFQTQRYLGRQTQMSLTDLLALANELDAIYRHVLANFGKDLPSTSFQYADDFIILATHIYYEAYLVHGHGSLLSIVLNLKRALANSPSNFQIKLLLLNLYSHLGAYDPLQKMYESMEIKNIQHYSTANLLLVHNIRLAALGSSSTVSTAMSQFFTSNLFDISNFLINSYKFGTFHKALEMCNFMESVSNSLTLNLCLTNAMSAMVITHALTGDLVISKTDTSSSSSDEEQLENNLRALRDRLSKSVNELQSISNAFKPEASSANTWPSLNYAMLVDHTDKDAIYQWDSTQEQSVAAKQYELVIDEQKRLLNFRFALVKFLNAQLACGESAKGDEMRFYREQIAKATSGLAANSIDEQTRICVTKSSYLQSISQLELNKLLVCFLDLSINLCQNGEKFLEAEQASNQAQLNQYKSQVKHICSETIFLKLGELISEAFSADLKIERINQLLEKFSSCLEVLSYVALSFAVACHTNKEIKTIWNEQIKKSKKKKALYLQYAESVNAIFGIYETLCHLVNYLHLQLKFIICPSISSRCEFVFSQVNSTSSLTTNNSLTPSNQLGDIGQSYQKSFDELKNHMNNKLKYLLKLSGNTVSSQLAVSLESLKLN